MSGPDWTYDEGDQSVGIWPGWVHEACPAEYEYGVDADECQMAPPAEPDEQGMGTVVYSLVCRDCEESALIERREFFGFDFDTFTDEASAATLGE